jgi:glycosyltransferase involved in cell wall biosynthesis
MTHPLGASHPKQQYRIGIDARFFRTTTGGIGRYTQELLRNLFALDHQNNYVVYITPEDVPDWNLDFPNVSVVVTVVKHYTPQEQTAFYQMLQRAKLDLVHFLNINHPVLYRRPFLVTLHDLTVLLFPEATKTRASIAKRQAFAYVLKRGMRAAKRVIAVTESTAHDAEQILKVPHARMEVIPHGGPERKEIPFGSKKLVQDYLGSKQPYILFVSQWRGHKGIATLVEAYEQYRQANPDSDIALVLTGNASIASNRLIERIQASPYFDDIIVPGFVPDALLPAVYAHAAVFVMPSEYEGFGLPALEAMTYGTPVILANNSSQPEVGGKAARYFATGDATDLAEVLTGVLAMTAEERAAMVAAGYTQVGLFDWRRTAERTLAVYYSILEKQR